jgi:PhnB protein
MQLNPYLNFNGQCEAAFKFYEKVLGGKIVMMMTYGDMPAGACEGSPMPDAARKLIAHARMMVGDVALMGSDAPHDRYERPQGTTINLGITDVAEAERTFQALAEGGKVLMPIQETFWAKRFGMVTDRFGTPWMVNCEKQMSAAQGAAA